MTIETELPAVKVKVENERLRHIVSDCAAALVSGAFISPKASVEFMEGLPKEISLVVSGLRSRIEELEKAVAYESGDPDAINGHRALFKRLHAAESRCEDLVKALEPFAQIADLEERAPPCASVMVNVDRCRDARSLIQKQKEG